MKLLTTILMLLILNLGYSQCGNTDFETGNFSGWYAKLGTCCPIALPNNGFTNGRQTIMTQGFDPNTCGALRTVYQGTYSARLGNSNVGSQAEGLYYTFTVSQSTNLIRYAYAVVFQNPNHLPNQQPRFQSRVRLPNGSVIPCTNYTVTAAAGLSGFQYCHPPGPDTSAVAWKDWTEVAVDLSAYVGQTVTIEFETGDCALGAHYGYAYIDAMSCGKTDNTVMYCQGDTSVTLNALGGFSHYQWPNGDTTQTTTVNPNSTSTVTCLVTTILGCQLTLTFNLSSYVSQSNFSYISGCDSVVHFTNLSTANYSPVNYLWNFGNGNSSTLTNPIQTILPGTHAVSLQMGLGSNCVKDTVINIFVPATPEPLFSVADVCLGQSSNFNNQTNPITGFYTSYLWNFGDGGQSILQNPSHTYLNANTYNVSLTATSNSSPPCSATYQGQTTVNAVPLNLGPINHN